MRRRRRDNNNHTTAHADRLRGPTGARAAARGPLRGRLPLGHLLGYLPHAASPAGGGALAIHGGPQQFDLRPVALHL